MFIPTREDVHKYQCILQQEADIYTYPIFSETDEKPDLIASSVIIRHDYKYYLITASHVFKTIKEKNKPFLIGVKNNKIIELTGSFVYSQSSDKDDFDIAYMELDSDFISINNITVLNSSKIYKNKGLD